MKQLGRGNLPTSHNSQSLICKGRLVVRWILFSHLQSYNHGWVVIECTAVNVSIPLKY